jgi:hypothetical protein
MPGRQPLVGALQTFTVSLACPQHLVRFVDLPGWSDDSRTPQKKRSKRKHGVKSPGEQLEHYRDLIKDCMCVCIPATPLASLCACVC